MGNPATHVASDLQHHFQPPGHVSPESQSLPNPKNVSTHRAATQPAQDADQPDLFRQQYARDNILQSYEVCIPEPCPNLSIAPSETKYWVLFIHGGAWRDPTVDAGSFALARDTLLTSPWYERAAASIAGYASLNYRLSPHPDYPQDMKRTHAYVSRNAKHPDHFQDIVNAIRSLQKRYGFGQRYLLVGHSCGATLAFQVSMGTCRADSEGGAEVNDMIDLPLGILGVDGIYDIPALLESFNDVKEYRESVSGAFGEDKKVWERVSPAKHGDYAASWPQGKLAMIAHSRRDELVDWKQVDLMENCWKSQEAWSGQLKVLELHSTHHEVWEKGEELARAIVEALSMLKRLEKKC